MLLAFAAGAMIFVVTEGVILNHKPMVILTSPPFRTHGWLCRHDGHGRGIG